LAASTCSGKRHVCCIAPPTCSCSLRLDQCRATTTKKYTAHTDPGAMLDKGLLLAYYGTCRFSHAPSHVSRHCSCLLSFYHGRSPCQSGSSNTNIQSDCSWSKHRHHIRRLTKLLHRGILRMDHISSTTYWSITRMMISRPCCG
jgi:hypothetical protein